jgi:hypothetical protein
VKPTLNSVQIQARITELKNGAKRRKALSPRTNALFSARKRAQSTAPKRVSFAVQEKFIEYELPVKTQEFHDMWAVQSIGTAFRVAFDEVHNAGSNKAALLDALDRMAGTLNRICTTHSTRNSAWRNKLIAHWASLLPKLIDAAGARSETRVRRLLTQFETAMNHVEINGQKLDRLTVIEELLDVVAMQMARVGQPLPQENQEHRGRLADLQQKSAQISLLTTRQRLPTRCVMACERLSKAANINDEAAYSTALDDLAEALEARRARLRGTDAAMPHPQPARHSRKVRKTDAKTVAPKKVEPNEEAQAVKAFNAAGNKAAVVDHKNLSLDERRVELRALLTELKPHLEFMGEERLSRLEEQVKDGLATNFAMELWGTDD